MSLFSEWKKMMGDIYKIAGQEELSLSQQVRGIFKATQEADKRLAAEEAAKTARREKPSC